MVSGGWFQVDGFRWFQVDGFRVDGFRRMVSGGWFQMVSGGWFQGGWFQADGFRWMVSEGFRWFQVIPTFCNFGALSPRLEITYCKAISTRILIRYVETLKYDEIRDIC